MRLRIPSTIAAQLLLLLLAAAAAAARPATRVSLAAARPAPRRLQQASGGCNGCADPACYCGTVPSGNYQNYWDSACASFIQCANGVATVTACPAGLVFNVAANACDWPASTTCTPGCTPSSPSPSPKPSPSPSPKPSPSPSPKPSPSPSPKPSPSPSPKPSPSPSPKPSPSPSPSPVPSPSPGPGGASCLKNVIYWGQNSVYHKYPNQADWEKDLAYYCESSDDYDVINLSFLHMFKDASSGTGPGGEALPNLNFAYHCDTTFASLGDAQFPNSALLKCPAIADGIKRCQARGKKVLLSLGGAAGVYGFASDAEATNFAKVIWQMFLGGTTAGWPRPFGDAILDGIDLDIEGGSSVGYAAFVTALRTKFTNAAANPSGRQYIIGAAPQCPVPDAYLNDALSKSWFDYVWVQFYNNYCAAANPANFNFNVWADWAAKTSVNPNVKVLLGLPAASYAAPAGGFIDIATVRTNVDQLASAYPNTFGGVMLWDAGVADSEKVDGGASFGAAVKAHLRTKSAAGCGASPPAPSPSPGASPAPSPSPKPSPSPSPKPSPSPSPSPAPGGCNGCSDAACYCKTVPTGDYANPFDAACTTFLKCANGVATVTPCPAGLIFNAAAKVCDWPANAVCAPGCPAAPGPSPSPAPVPSPSPGASPAPSPSPSPPPSPPPVNPALPTGPLIVGYYQTWSAPWVSVGANMDLANIPGYVNVVILSFVRPDCTYAKGSLTLSGTGLDFSSDGAVVRDAVAALKAKRPNTRVLLAVGGATYTNFAGINTQCIKDIVTDFGLDGADIDWEPSAPNCVATGTSVSCPTDAESVNAVTKMRAAMPKGQYILSTASFHVGAYGAAGAFAASKPVTKYTGINLAMAKSTAGQSLDLINIMSYDAGSITSTGFDPKESFRAHRAVWPNAAVALGVEVPPEAWGGNIVTLNQVSDFAKYVRTNGGAGMMLWSLHKKGTPSAQGILTRSCTVMNMTSCSTLIPM
ncbi:chitinase [Raphidocelis subcapitata]|uniref:chitinase n=1 Tax=Raphidocelis subcapitata TaxID=307507 RepID=A0A2V0P7X3_9CHLO|nr:chitinase [Raphidocelis subcapitata]|eukprot:GBF95961.1 chitinase [Raphidocelis subcapitata]